MMSISEQDLKDGQFTIKSIQELLEQRIDMLEEAYNKRSLVTGMATGFLKLDALTSGLQNSDLIIIAARPSMGKPAFALNIVRNVAVDGNVPVAVFPWNCQGLNFPFAY